MFTCPKRPQAAHFHVSIHDFSGMFQLKLEGPFTAAEAPEVEARWRTASSIIGNREFRVDLRDVTTVDAAGRGLLGRMRESGADLIAGAGPTHGESRSLEFLACLFARLRALTKRMRTGSEPRP